ncbi:MAG: methyltransferase domain-containing protein, partial [Ignavibacteria bacterium]
MQNKLLEYICCPIDKKELKLTVYNNFNKKYSEKEVEECSEGLLLSSSGWMYPIVGGVPRMQLDAFLEYETFLNKHYKDYNKQKEMLLKSYSHIIKSAVKKTRKTRKSFGREWAIFKYESDTTWGFTKESRKKRFLEELQTTPGLLQGKTLLDIGCGNGVLTSALAEFGMETFGIDVSLSVEAGFRNNSNVNAHYLQADLQNVPFKISSIDIVYSTGVLHHTNNTELSFSRITPLVKPGGRLYIWLYKPEKDFRHNFLINLRKVTNKFPIRLQYLFYLIFLVPQGLIKERLRGKKITWREQLINYFDVLSCEFRHEHTP